MKIDYFSHDTKARSDSKIVDLVMRYGMEGLGVYWCIVEMLYENEGRIMRTQCERIAFELRTHEALVNGVIYDCDLFDYDEQFFWSYSVLKRLDSILSKSNKARESALKRWEPCERNANALPTQCEGNAIKRKEKEIKENNIKEKSGRFTPPTINEVREYMKQQQMDDLAEKWHSYYQSNGWKVGKNSMKDWKAAVRTWKQNTTTDKTNNRPKLATL